jgi:ferredoxin-NADP reductase
MLRTLDRRGTMPDVVMHYSSPTPERMLFRDEVEQLEQKYDGFTLHKLNTDTEGMLEMQQLDEICPDWKERVTYACGPAPLLDAIHEHFDEHDLEDQLHIERFSLDLGSDEDAGGTLTFQNSSKTVECDGATTVLEAGEEAGIGMPFGCRMGICHTCTLTMIEGKVRDMRNGDEFYDPNERVQTCVTVPVGDCKFDI